MKGKHFKKAVIARGWVTKEIDWEKLVGVHGKDMTEDVGYSL